MAGPRWDVVVDVVREVSLARVEVRVRGRVRERVVPVVLMIVSVESPLDEVGLWPETEVESVASEMRDGGYVADSCVVTSLPVGAVGTFLVVTNCTGFVVCPSAVIV